MDDIETVRACLREWKPMRALLTETGLTSPELALDRLEAQLSAAEAERDAEKASHALMHQVCDGLRAQLSAVRADRDMWKQSVSNMAAWAQGMQAIQAALDGASIETEKDR